MDAQSPRRSHRKDDWTGRRPLNRAACKTLALACFLTALGRGADNPIDAHVAFTVLQPAPFALSKKSTPGPGKRLQVWLAAEDACTALLVAFDKSGHLAWPTQPVLLPLQPHAELQAPTAGDWKWETPDALGEFDVVFLDSHSPDLPQLTQLVDAMHAGAAPPVRTRQIAELRRMIDSLTQRAAAGEYSIKMEPVSLAGLLRGMGCDWCKDAQKIAIPRGGSYLVRQRFP